MAFNIGKPSGMSTRKATFDGNPFELGVASGQTLEVELTTDSLSGRGGSAPASNACTIVEEFNTNYDVRSRVDIKEVRKRLGRPATMKRIMRAKKPGPVLEALGLEGLLMLADYNQLNASRFIKGHLLAQSLGGRGDNANMTPMDRSANALWSNSFEQPVRNALKAALPLQKSLKQKVVIVYTVKVDGKMKPWFPNATDETRDLLAQLPSRLIGSIKVKGFIPEKSGALPVGPKEKAEFVKLFSGISLDLSL